jgi:hypothetical protein
MSRMHALCHLLACAGHCRTYLRDPGEDTEGFQRHVKPIQKGGMIETCGDGVQPRSGDVGPTALSNSKMSDS